MKRCLAWIMAVGICGFGAFASAPQESSSPSPLFDKGTIMYLELSKTLDAKKAKPGDEVRGILLADVLSHGKIVLRQDARLLGHITVVQPFSKDKPESRLGIVFEKVVGKGGQETAFSSVLMTISPAPRLRVESIAGPAPLNINPAGGGAQQKRSPTPSGASTSAPPSYRDPFGNKDDRDRVRRGGDDVDMQPTDIEGLTLVSAPDGNRVVVSFKNNVKLESGVRLALRVTNPGQTKKTQTP
jgi:hypothetical protein